MKRSAVLSMVLFLGLQGSTALAQQGFPQAKITSVQQVHNVIRDGQKGLLIKLNFQVNNLQNQEVFLCAFFNWKNGTPLKAIPGSAYMDAAGYVYCSRRVIPNFQASTFTGVELFIPLAELNIQTPGKHNISFFVEIQYGPAQQSTTLASTGNYSFSLDIGPKTGASSLVGLKLSGSETLANYGALAFSFQANNRVFMYDADGITEGIWTQSGNQVTLTFNNGGVVYVGTLTGNTLSGVATNGKNTWNWSVSK
jgi:hypothetical protein